MERVTLDHGSGGLAARELVRRLFVARLDNPLLAPLEDSAVLPPIGGRLAFTTDSYVVDPLFFPGGDIGLLAVNGTVNDLAMRGARPLALSLGMILEEGLEMEILARVADSIAAAAERAGVPVVTGDTKVVPRGAADKMFINTSGVGVIADGVEISPRRLQGGDAVILSASMGDHGITVLAARAELGFSGTELKSDTAALHRMTAAVIARFPGAVHALRDPTRGGVATALCELAAAGGLELEIDEIAIPLRPPVRAAGELLGIDPFFLANEGSCIMVVEAADAADVVAELRRHPEGGQAAVIGRVKSGEPGRVVLHTAVGGRRRLRPLTGDPLPRIC
ncbi:MAG: hydrogenase expression/formation protein HypE [Deltaproteobacteria bacterium]|nr:hydrogenase expression/formation protein HypE [Candidatus Anaeroferrophillacea bacterium]